MTAPKLDRRQVLKLEAAAMAALAGGMPVTAVAANLVTDRAASELKWDKAPCRFCGTGCGVMVGVKDGRVVATQGDMQAEVNRGLNCVKGYFLSKIMYGEDRLTTAAAAQEGRQVRQGRRVRRRCRWDEAFDVMAEKCKAALKEQGPRPAVGMFGSGQWTIWEGYAAAKLMQGRLPLQQHRPQRAPLHGLGGGRLHAHLRHRRADGLLRRHRSTPMPSCCGARTWPRCTRSCGRGVTDRRLTAAARQGRGAVDLRAPQLRPGRHRASSSSRRPIWRSSTTSPTTSSRPAGSTRTSSTSTRNFKRGADRHRLRPAPRASAARRRPRTPPSAGDCQPIELRGVREVRRRLHAGEGRRSCPACRANRLRGAGRALCRPEDQGHVASGPWASTSTPAASGPTTWSTTSTC